jgi:hypothetical protein
MKQATTSKRSPDYIPRSNVSDDSVRISVLLAIIFFAASIVANCAR